MRSSLFKIVILVILGILVFWAVDPIERQAKAKDDMTAKIIQEVVSRKELPRVDAPSVKGDLVNGDFVVYGKLIARANYTRCNLQGFVPWEVYSSNDKKEGVVCLPKGQEPQLGSQNFLP